MAEVTDLKIWGRKSSANVQKVMWLVGELGLAHQRIDVGGKFGGTDSDDFLAMNPNRLVPVLQVGDQAIWESHTILRYIAGTTGNEQFWPQDPLERAQQDMWLDWAQTRFFRSFIDLFWAYWRTPEEQRNEKVIARRKEAVLLDVAFLDEALAERPYLAGETLSLADIPAGCGLYRYYTMGMEFPDFPNMRAWYDRLTERPAYQTHVMISYEELRGRVSF